MGHTNTQIVPSSVRRWSYKTLSRSLSNHGWNETRFSWFALVIQWVSYTVIYSWWNQDPERSNSIILGCNHCRWQSGQYSEKTWTLSWSNKTGPRKLLKTLYHWGIDFSFMFRKVLSVEPDHIKFCNLRIYLMHQAKVAEAKLILQKILHLRLVYRELFWLEVLWKSPRDV